MTTPPPTTSNIFDVQASDGTHGNYHYVNLRVHVLAATMERAIELFRVYYPEARLHQVIKRSTVTQVIIDPELEGL